MFILSQAPAIKPAESSIAQCYLCWHLQSPLIASIFSELYDQSIYSSVSMEQLKPTLSAYDCWEKRSLICGTLFGQHVRPR